MWPFRRKKPEVAPDPKPEPLDHRVWNEDWKVGDIAECIIDGGARHWHPDLPPWERPAFGQRFVVADFIDGRRHGDRARAYFLKLEGWPVNLETTAFRKVRPVATEESEVVQRILSAKPGADRVREGA